MTDADGAALPRLSFAGLSERRITRRSFLRGLVAAGVIGPVASVESVAQNGRNYVPIQRLGILTLLAVIQPASGEQVLGLVDRILPELSGTQNAHDVEAVLEEFSVNGWIISVAQGHYSLTALGQSMVPLRAQFLRDRARLFLMRGTPHGKVVASRGSGTTVAGVPPSSVVRARIEDFITRLPPSGVVVFKIADSMSGLSTRPRETGLSFISFESLAQVNAALGLVDSSTPLSLHGFALSVGISPALLGWFIDRPESAYRQFDIPKRSGGRRLIESPRVFLKVLQRLIGRYFISELRVHPAVHSFRRGRSSQTNAIMHEGARFVGSIDILDFFGSVTLEMIVQCLVTNGFESEFSKRLAQLCSRRGVLPQGAPTSPIISNAVLYDFDEAIFSRCAAGGIQYTRYADDMVMSGEDREAIVAAFDFVRRELILRGMRLNEEKTRIAAAHQQQRVTGAVVNLAAAPSRQYRRKLRAIFHHVQREPSRFTDERRRLAGHISYLKGFPKLRRSSEVQRYEAVMEMVPRR